MKKPFLLYLVILIHSTAIFSQGFILTEPKLEFDGYKLTISYDLVSKNHSDIFSIWVEIQNQAGKPVRAYSFKGEVGDSVKPGNNKIITWVPENDAVYLDEEITVELKGEKFIKSFNKGSMIVLSTLVPGLGQTKIKSKPWWLGSIPAYGTLAGGVVLRMKYNETYDKYLKSIDAVERADLLNQSVKENNIAGAMFITSGVIWISNIIWTAAIPNRYKPLQHTKLSLDAIPVDKGNIPLLSFKVEF